MAKQRAKQLHWGQRRDDGKAGAFELPADDAVAQTFALLASKGAGKTYAASKLAELMLGAGHQVVVIDVVGKWYGLRLGADGERAGFEIPIVGGRHGDVPIEAGAGELLADLVVQHRTSMVLDVSELRKNQRRQLVTDFAEALYHGQKNSDEHPLHLFLEEAQVFVPQQSRGNERLVGAFEDIIRLGRNCGIGCTMISQRPQSVNKEVLNMTECLAVLQMAGRHEREAIRDWITEQGLNETLVKELPALARGEAIVWSPSWLRFAGRVQIAARTTYDASATPSAANRKHAPAPRPIDIDTLTTRMREVREKVESEDPAKLKKRIQHQAKRIEKLEQQLQQSEQRVHELAEQLERQPAPADGESSDERVEGLLETLKQIHVEIESLASRGDLFPFGLSGGDAIASRTAKSEGKSFTNVSGRQPAAGNKSGNKNPRKINAASSQNSDTKLNASMRRMLAVLAQRRDMGHATTDRATLGALAGIKPSGGTFGTYLSRLRTAGHIDGTADALSITDVGLAALGDGYEAPPAPGRPRLDWLMDQHCNQRQRDMLEQLHRAYPRGMSRDKLAIAIGVEPNGGTYSTYLSRLRSRGIIQGSSELRLTAAVMEG